jgi:hypothetical protein
MHMRETVLRAAFRVWGAHAPPRVVVGALADQPAR